MAFSAYESVIILFLFIFRHIASNCTGIYCAIEVSGTYPQILPRKGARSAVGYDQSTDTIIILGGSSFKQYVTFDKSTFNDENENYMSDGVYGTGQYYSQLDTTLWMINDNTPTFITMNTITRTINYPSTITIPTDVGTRGCLATVNYNNNKYLFVVGGYNSNDGYLNLIQVYNISSQQWIHLPSMQTARRSASCIIKANILYVIGGKNDGIRVASIEYFNIDKYFSNIPNQQWTYTNGDLSVAVDSAIVVSYGNDIIVVGGMDINDLYPTDINVINTMTNVVRIDGCLVTGVLNPSVIVVGNVLYVFGGSDTNGITDKYQYINLFPTISPTKSPTLNPSLLPTKSPILNPTKIPTIFPTISPISQTISPISQTINPSNYPSINPTKSPTKSPSYNPSNIPTKTPTNIPSVSPTYNPSNAPANGPSNSPTKLPSNMPTILPTQSPTNIPTYNPMKTISTYPTTDKLDSASGQITDDIMSTYISEQNNVVQETHSNITTVFISFVIGFGSAILCCIIVFISYLYMTKSRKRKMSDDRKRKTKQYNLNISEGLPDTTVQLSQILADESTKLSTNITTTNETETYINTIIETDSEVNSSNENCNDDNINIYDLTMNNNIITAGYIANDLIMRNDNETKGMFDENRIVNTITAGFIDIDGNIEENNDMFEDNDNQVMTPRFKKTAGDEFMAEGEETDEELNFETIQ